MGPNLAGTGPSTGREETGPSLTATYGRSVCVIHQLGRQPPWRRPPARPVRKGEPALGLSFKDPTSIVIGGVNDAIDASRFHQGQAPGDRLPCTGEACCAGTVSKYSATWPNGCDYLCSEQACPGCERARPQLELNRLPCSSFATPLQRLPPTRSLHRVMVNHWLIQTRSRERVAGGRYLGAASPASGMPGSTRFHAPWLRRRDRAPWQSPS